MVRSFALALVVLLTAPLLLTTTPTSAAPGFDGRPDEIALPASSGPGLSAAGGFDYRSPEVTAPRPFTHLLLKRDARVPDGAQVIAAVRAFVEPTGWTAWQEVNDDHDLNDDRQPDITYSSVVDVGATASRYQVRAFFVANTAGERPVLRGISVSSVNAAAPARSVPQTAATPGKPNVVSRVGWGSPDGAGSRVAPSYRSVTHLVVHHTYDSNSLTGTEQDWAARVRATWSFHTYTRGWGDVGYNYLIDRNGVIYEGRAGGDDAVAFHDKANFGSMGVVLIGNFLQDGGITPTKAAQDALVRLLSWKAGQKQIDPLGRAFYYGCQLSRECMDTNPGAIVPTIAGHRQVLGYPGTTCPGELAFNLLPEIRNRVKQTLASGGQDNGDLQIDELESGFSRSNANWYDAPCGAGGHTFYTFGTDGALPYPSSNRGEWQPQIGSPGAYRVYAAIPRGCGLGIPTSAASYNIYNGDTLLKTVTISQQADQDWVSLGVFSLGANARVTLSDLTGDPFSTNPATRRAVFFDAVRFVPENTDANVALTGVDFDRTSLAAGELLKVTFTVKNIGGTTLYGQGPRVDLTAGGGLGGVVNGYPYEQNECYAGDRVGSTAAFPKETNRFRVTLGYTGWDAARNAGPLDARCNAPMPAGSPDDPQPATADNPWRWGLNSALRPGQSQTVIGYVRFTTPGVYTLRANLIQEYVKYFYDEAAGFQPTQITVTPERSAPLSAALDAGLAPQAQVYKLGALPDSYLARASDGTGVTPGAYVGSFSWQGALADYQYGGPLGQTDRYMVQQTRAFRAPVSGSYTFRTSSDDGSWLWVDGQPVVRNGGLHELISADGTVALSAGVHTVTFRGFDLTGAAAFGYEMRPPGAAEFGPLPDVSITGADQLAGQLSGPAELTLALDAPDRAEPTVIWRLNGGPAQQTSGRLLRLALDGPGSYLLSYRVTDALGNSGPEQTVRATVRTDLHVRWVYAPLIHR